MTQGGSGDAGRWRDMFRGIGQYSPLRQYLPELGLATIFLNLLSLVLPMSLLLVYDRIVPNESFASLSVLVVLVLCAALIEATLRLSRAYLSGWVGTRFEHQAGCGAMRHLLSTSIPRFEAVGAGLHLERMTSLTLVEDFFAGEALLTLLDLPFAFIFLAAIALIGGELALIPGALVLVFVAATILRARRLRQLVNGHMVAHARRQNFIIEVLRGIHSVKALAMESLMLRRYERLQETCAQGDYDVARQTNDSMAMGTFFSQIILVSVAAYGSLLVIDGQLSVGSLAACTLLAGRTLQPVQRLASLWNRFQTIRLASERLRAIFTLPAEEEAEVRPLEDYKGGLELRDVVFAYPGTERRIIDGASIVARPGECIGISGDNGSGKSTLLALMMGTLTPSAGQILLDGKDVTNLSRVSIKRYVGYLPQDGVLFQGTIRDNITMFRPEFEDAVDDIAHLLGLDDVVARMPLGWDTRVGDTAAEAIPRGVKQRIAVARALVHRPRLVLFDEANSAVDGTGDLYIRRALEHLRGTCTIVLVTPRPSLLALAGRVYDLSEGALVPRQAPDNRQPQRTGGTIATAGGEERA